MQGLAPDRSRKVGDERMTQNDLIRFADDLRHHTGLDIGLVLDPSPDGLHVLAIDGADYFFYANGSGYDGWGKKLPNGEDSNCRRVEGSDRHPNSETPVPRKEPGKNGK